MISACFFPLSKTTDSEFILLGLERFASEREDLTCLIVPCNSRFERFIDQNKIRLEKRFIIRSPLDIEGSLNHGAEMPYA